MIKKMINSNDHNILRLLFLTSPKVKALVGNFEKLTTRGKEAYREPNFDKTGTYFLNFILTS